MFDDPSYLQYGLRRWARSGTQYHTGVVAPLTLPRPQVDVTAGELSRWRSARVRHLISPLRTVLDDSIGCAVWFAARGAGVLAGEGGERRYRSQARVGELGMSRWSVVLRAA